MLRLLASSQSTRHKQQLATPQTCWVRGLLPSLPRSTRSIDSPQSQPPRLCHCRPHPTRHHSYCPRDLLAWSNRFPRILQQVEQLQPDLLCLQEVQSDVYEQLAPWMAARGWGSVFAPRAVTQASTTLGPCDGVTLHFRQSQFELLASEQIRFADHAAAVLPGACCSRHTSASSRSGRSGRGGGGGAAGSSAFMQALMQREEGAVLALLRHTPSQSLLVACSTHLHWNPQVPDIKLAQAALLCHCISRFIQQQQQQQTGQQQQQQQQVLCDIPVVVGGDFNSLYRKYKSDIWDTVSVSACAF